MPLNEHLSGQFGKETWSKDGILLANKNEGKFNFFQTINCINKLWARIVSILKGKNK